jgi:pantetheine-phosphate adenylyltransferase
LVEEALRIFDKVVIGIGANVAKQGLLSVEQRKQLISDIYRNDERVEVASYTSLTADFAREVGATALIRGVRNTIDFEFEHTMEAANRHLAPELTTVLLIAPAELGHISSSMVRELLAFGRDVSEYLPQNIDIKNYL